MSPAQDPLPSGIGGALKDARRRIGMDVKEAEERTKIRARYLRALEAEDWEALPGPAYVRGFLRTYGQLVGLDGEMLADEFRRRHEAPETPAIAASEPVLKERRRVPGSRPTSRGPLISAIAAAIIVLLIILSWLGSDDDSDPVVDERPSKASLKPGGEGGAGKRGGGDGKPKARKPIDLTVEPLDAIQLCLVGGSGEALIDAQMLAAGATESYEGFKKYRLDLEGAGAVRLTAGDESQRLQSQGSASFEADSNGIREIDYAGPDCP